MAQCSTQRKMSTSGTGKGKKAVATGGKEKREKCAWPIEDTTEFLNLIKANKKLGGLKMSYKPEFWTMIAKEMEQHTTKVFGFTYSEKKGVNGNLKKDINQFKNSGWVYFDLMQEMMPEHVTGAYAFRAKSSRGWH
ncbi:hypothetical protein SERLA73DRAFT_149106 [Serpula lacrymans var. lacrymans S7.3]|uniref:Myb/SANT-like domain-containing protein n=1 Tax=Serpula lacrymans var. lacrymans (strain S7.3) TaxID=936435 RepID=F8PF25_SERL3|nr:hypothetical protein SERLA73DRAFT_149106 [Serpula lacrymans var. lacrymans S7.3]